MLKFVQRSCNGEIRHASILPICQTGNTVIKNEDDIAEITRAVGELASQAR